MRLLVTFVGKDGSSCSAGTMKKLHIKSFDRTCERMGGNEKRIALMGIEYFYQHLPTDILKGCLPVCQTVSVRLERRNENAELFKRLGL